MKSVILGAGVIGVTTAYFLASNGHEVEVVDRNDSPARETSFSNGGQISFSNAEPWASLSSLSKLPQWLLDPKSPLIFRLTKDPEMYKWCIKFLLNSSPVRTHVNAITMLRLGLYSKKIMEKLIKETDVKFHNGKHGTLHLFSKETALAKMERHYSKYKDFGIGLKFLDRKACEEIEPQIKQAGKQIFGGFHATLDETGDAELFTRNLAKLCEEKFKVKFRYNCKINSLSYTGNKISHIKTSQGDIKSENFIVALGAYSPKITATANIKIPIYPMKGYSITIPIKDDFKLKPTVTDADRKIVFTSLGNQLRVAGTAEVCGYDNSLNAKRIKQMIDHTNLMFPQVKIDEKSLTKWACLRSQTPEGPPILGLTPYYDNLYLNTGHGALGWTQTAACGKILADIINKNTPSLPMDGLTFRK